MVATITDTLAQRIAEKQSSPEVYNVLFMRISEILKSPIIMKVWGNDRLMTPEYFSNISTIEDDNEKILYVLKKLRQYKIEREHCLEAKSILEVCTATNLDTKNHELNKVLKGNLLLWSFAVQVGTISQAPGFYNLRYPQHAIHLCDMINKVRQEAVDISSQLSELGQLIYSNSCCDQLKGLVETIKMPTSKEM